MKDHKEAIYNIMENLKNEMLWRLENEYKRGYEDGREYEQMLRTPKHDADRLEEVKDLIRESDKIDAYTLSYPAWVFINKLKKVVGFELTDYEERQTETETWSSFHGKTITVPKGTFDKIFNDADEDDCDI